MSHLNKVGLGYFAHLIRAWHWAFCLFIHGLIPEIWQTKVSDKICNNSSTTRKYLLMSMYNIDEGSLNKPTNK